MTSPAKEIEVICPGCHRVVLGWHRASINLGLGRVWTDEEISAATTVQCPNCKTRIRPGYLVVEESQVFQLSEGDPILKGRRGRVFTSDIEFIWWSDGTWTSEQEPELAHIFTRVYDNSVLSSDLNTDFDRQWDYESVLKRISSNIENSRWEVLVLKAK